MFFDGTGGLLARAVCGARCDSVPHVNTSFHDLVCDQLIMTRLWCVRVWEGKR